MIGFLFVGQTFLYQMQAETSPIYVILTSFAMCADAVVKKEENESILDESRELIVPETISEESLAEMDKAVEDVYKRQYLNCNNIQIILFDLCYFIGFLERIVYDLVDRLKMK